MTLLVEGLGPLATIQDLGRAGHADVGVSESGAMDRPALRRANHLVGNPADCAAVEVLLGGLVVRALRPTVVAVTGAAVPLTGPGPGHPGDAEVPMDAPVHLAVGQGLRLGPPSRGLWSYLAVRGGLTVERVYGSASSDRTGGLGPAPLWVGQRLDVGPSEPDAADRSGHAATASHASPRATAAPAGQVVLHAVLGPRDDWFAPAAVRLLREAIWTVTSDTDRVGTRLHGPRLPRARAEELPSEGVLRGSVQVPPSGQPLVFLADHPSTGGYPVIAVLDDADTDRLAQVRPGERVRFALRRAAWS